MNDIKVKLTWFSFFDTEEELENFLKAVGEVHAMRYGTNVAVDSLLENGYYDGRLNFIRTTITRPEKAQGVEFRINDHVIIKEFIGDKYNETGRVTAVSEDGRYHVSNMNMPFMGTVSKWFTADELEHNK